MKIQTMIMLGHEGPPVLRHLESAMNLVGAREEMARFGNMRTNEIADLPPGDLIRFHEIKSLRRMLGDQFSNDDVQNGETLIRRLAQDLIAKADAGGVFLDPKLDAVFSDGVRSNSTLALRELDTFLTRLRELINEYHGDLS